MNPANAKAKPDRFDPNAPYVEFDGGIAYLQKEILFGPDRNPMGSTTTCHNRQDGVRYLIADRAYDVAGRFLGLVDQNNGNALIPAQDLQEPEPESVSPSPVESEPETSSPAFALVQEEDGDTGEAGDIGEPVDEDEEDNDGSLLDD